MRAREQHVKDDAGTERERERERGQKILAEREIVE